MRRMALLNVMPKPRSSGSAITVAVRCGSDPGSISSFSGLISDCQFFCRTTLSLMASHPPPLARPASVMRDGGHVANGGDGETHGLQGAQRALATRTRATDLDLQRFHAVLAGLLAGILGGD